MFSSRFASEVECQIRSKIHDLGKASSDGKTLKKYRMQAVVLQGLDSEVLTKAKGKKSSADFLQPEVMVGLMPFHPVILNWFLHISSSAAV